MHHPWRRLRDHLPDWHVIEGPLPGSAIGATDTRNRVIHLAPGMLQRQRRAVLDHELVHAEAGDQGRQHPKRERAIDIASARRLVTIDQLVDAAVWAHDVEELADECWVDVQTIRCRLDNLTDDERAQVRRAIAIRDWHEEGM